MAIALVAFAAAFGPDHAAGQILDRIMARVGATPILMTDVQAAVGLGIVSESAQESALRQVIDRQLLLVEILRFPLSEPPASEIDAELARMRTHAGAALDSLMRSTGHDQRRLRDVARDTVRIRGYVRQRFGAARIDDDDVQRWLRDARTRAVVAITPEPSPQEQPAAPPAR